MAEKKPPQKTQLLTDAPPEVQAAIDRQSQKGGSAPPSGQATMMLDSPQAAAPAPQSPQQSGGRQVVVPTAMQNRPSGGLPAVKQRRQSTVGRWIAGPLIAVGVAAGTVALAGVVMPIKAKVVAPVVKAQGKLRLETSPPGASVTIDGKPFPHFTPTEYEGEVGTTLKVGFRLDGYQNKEQEVVIASGEQPFSVKLDKVEAPPPVAPPPVVSTKHEHHSSSKTPPPSKEPAGKGTISVFVRPWAIVFVDGARLRQTPVQSYDLAAGKHTIELANDPKAKKEKIQVVIKAGESQEIRRDWDK